MSAELARVAGRAVDRSETSSRSRRLGVRMRLPHLGRGIGRFWRSRQAVTARVRAGPVTRDLEKVGETCRRAGAFHESKVSGSSEKTTFARCRRSRREDGQFERIARLQQFVVRGSAEPLDGPPTCHPSRS